MDAPSDTTIFEAAGELATIPKFPYLLAAYGTVFVVLFIYLVTIHLRQQRIDREIRALERRLER
jgi:CcmD family protein